MGVTLCPRFAQYISLEINPAPHVEDPEKLRRSGLLVRNGFFIFFRVKENESKENARVPWPLRGYPARLRHDQSARKLPRHLAGSDLPEAGKQVRALLSGRIGDARHGTKGIQNQQRKSFSNLLQKADLRSPLWPSESCLEKI